MRNDHIPTVSLGAEALSALLDYDEAEAEQKLRQLPAGELFYLHMAADNLSRLARRLHGMLRKETILSEIREGVKVVHLSPRTGEAVVRCCGRPIFELALTSKITNDERLVTCPDYPWGEDR